MQWREIQRPAAGLAIRIRNRLRLGWLVGPCWLALVSCERGEPPGVEGEHQAAIVVGVLDSNHDSQEVSAERLGTIDDNLPFDPTGRKVASIAWRTWIYTDTGPKRTRFGYLRAGAVVDARGPAIRNTGCAGGWYRINPRGFVCLGKGATTDLQHPVIAELSRRPIRGQGFPYSYVLSEERGPPRYFKLPNWKQMAHMEGEGVRDGAVAWQLRAKESGLLERLGVVATPPSYLAPGQALVKPYGAPKHPRREVSAGWASSGSGFALLDTFLWQGRAFGVTSEVDIVPLDRVKIPEPSTMRGLELGPGEELPVAFHVKGFNTLWKQSDDGRFVPQEELRDKRGFKLTGARATGGLLETKDGVWIAESTVRLVQPRDSFPSVATGTRRWIDISMKDQTLVAYEGKKPVYVTLISAGRGGLGDRDDDNPEGHRTVRGTFMIHEKSLSSTMDGDEDRADNYELTDVPFVQYFHRGFALHGAYWHDEFGRQRSHGCVNLSPRDSAYLFEWTDPPLPEGWHAVLNKERGTVVYVRY